MWGSIGCSGNVSAVAKKVGSEVTEYAYVWMNLGPKPEIGTLSEATPRYIVWGWVLKVTNTGQMYTWYPSDC